MAVIDADTHVIETERTWDYMDPSEEQFRPIIVTPKDERGWEHWYIDGKIRGLVRQAVTTPDVSQLEKKFGRKMAAPQEAREGENVAVRLRHMDELGVDIQVLWPTSPAGPWVGSREALAFPEFYDWYAKGRPGSVAAPVGMVCTGPITYQGQAAIRTDIANVKAALQGVQPEEVFMPAISPTNIEGPRRNEYYPTQEAYLYAIADAMREEYQSIVAAGFLLQIDDPRLVTYYGSNPGMSLEQCLEWAELRVEVLNYALRDIPPDRVRFHTCYGINIGPRVHEVALKDVVHLLLEINAGAYSFEAANPRHEHEWRVWESVVLPEGKVLIPGVISHSTNIVEHPELVADRIVRCAHIVGRENVIAGSDCGFSSQATTEPEIHPTVVWAKFQAMAEGARLASAQLWD